MLLSKLKVKNFLSVNGDCELPIDGRVTILLGANDHGKSNLLRALEHLNFDTPIRVDDQNWDSKGARLDFVFQMSAQEMNRLGEIRDALKEEYLRVLNEAHEQSTMGGEETEADNDADNNAEEQGGEEEIVLIPSVRSGTPLPINVAATAWMSSPARGAAVVPTTTTVSILDDEEEEDQETDSDSELTSAEILEDLNFLEEIMKSPVLTLTRDGIGAELSITGRSLKELPEDVYKSFSEMIPRVELFKAFSGELQDSVTAAEIQSPESEFLQGIFFYAGINPLDCADLFHPDDETERTLEVASKELDEELRRLWAQGVDLDLHFQLRHRGDAIEFVANDPAVKKRHARMSKRSAGVTQFFRLSMVLHARRQKNPANSYIYVFDEPGVFLHPKGQKDLLAVFEQLAEDTQIVYATHSLFMLNQNYPERHRLITKSKYTTLVDSKPYRANWRYAVDALGVRLTANILFSPNILLVEGDSDPIYLYELFRVLNHTGAIDADANLLGIMSYSDLPNLRFLLQTFKAENKERLIHALFDGDSQGKEYERTVSSLCKTLEVKTQLLDNGFAIEDYCLYPDLFLRAVEMTLKFSYEATSKPAPTDLTDLIKKSWEEFTARKTRIKQSKPKKPVEAMTENAAEGQTPTSTVVSTDDKAEQNGGYWFKQFSTELVGAGGSSKVALARNYAFLSRENEVTNGLDAKKVQQAKDLVEQIITALNLPNMKAKKAIEG
jgi:predicted ATPase